tara:strand:- start:77 stop:250 length:174 start_codon:yes stop_codon:yes gene_type:complete
MMVTSASSDFFFCFYAGDLFRMATKTGRGFSFFSGSGFSRGLGQPWLGKTVAILLTR